MKLGFLHIAMFLFAFIIQSKADGLRYSADNPLIFGIDMDYPPLEYVDDDGIPHGYDITFTQEVMKRLGLPFTYSPNTWENISGDVLSGRVDLGMMVYSPYRKNLTNYSRAVFRLYYQIVYRKNDKDYFDLRNLAGKSIAYMASRPIHDTLTSAGAVLYEVKNLANALKDLSKGHYDAVICFRYQSRYILEKYNLENLRSVDLTLYPREYCYVSHDKQLIDSINVVLNKMEADGLIENYYGDEITSSFGGFKIPDWVWYLLVALIFVFLLVFIFFQHRYQKQLRWEMQRVQKSEQLKTVFLGNVSHALRTPLNAIIGFSEVMGASGDAVPAEERQQMLRLINANGQQLLYFINQLLELSEIESGDQPLNYKEIEVGKVLKSYLDEFRDNVAKGVELLVEGDDLRVKVDERYLRIVTKHFLANAVSHTKQGHILLRYFLINHGLRIEVEDTGEGIPEALKENIFNLMSDKSTFIQDEVPGLGLTICKAIIDRCAGHIGVISPESGGAIFWQWIPVGEVGKSEKIKS